MTRATGVGKCRDCGVGIRFIYLTTSRKTMPVDPTPDEDGNVIARTLSGRLTGHVLIKGEEIPDGWTTWMPHFATCRYSTRRVARGRRRPMTLFDEIETETRTTPTEGDPHHDR